MKNLLITILFFTCISGYAQPNTFLLPQTHIYFDLGSYKLTAKAKHTIDSLIYADGIQPDQLIRIVGYTDNIGDSIFNLALSRKRSHEVAKYLFALGIDSNQVEEITGKGEIKRPGNATGYPLDRMVGIITDGALKKNQLVRGEGGQLIATIHFKYTTSIFAPSALKLLDTVVAVLKQNPKQLVNIDGFVCCFNYDNLSPTDYHAKQFSRFTDTSRLNGASRLSIKRANIIYAYLKGHGIDSTRVQCHAYGYLKNKVLPNGEYEHGKDRVEIRVLK